MNQKKALIVRLGAIGDVITIIPAARALYERGFEIHWACGKAVCSLLECYSWIHLLPVDDVTLVKGAWYQRAREVIRFWSSVAHTKWDMSAVLYYRRHYRVLTLPVRARRRVVLSKRSREKELISVRYYTDEFERILLGLEDDCRPRCLALLRPDRLPPSPLPQKSAKRRVAIVPGGASNLISQQILRRWPIEHYVALATEVIRREWEVVLLGGSEDVWVRPYFRDLQVTDCIGKVSVPEVISICDSCDGVISHDTGPMHLAGMSSACLVAIFGPSNPSHVLPRRTDVVGIWGGQEYACRPCYDFRTYAQCKSAECIRKVTPDLVIRHMDRLLEERSRGMAEPWQIISP